MRVGNNPHKDKLQEKSEYIHQVLIPVYIPNHEDYFKDSFKILQICMESLFKTIHDKTFITLINNGSCEEVKEYLDLLFVHKKIHEVVHTTNIGKVNSIVKGLAGNNIDLVTISDSDVLFLPEWQSETVKTFNAFPKSGVVGIVPQYKNFSHLCGNIIIENLFSKKMKFSAIKNKSALLMFFESIGWKIDNQYNQAQVDWNLTIENENAIAIVGSGHFVTTYKRELFKEMKSYFEFKLGADTERYLDEKPLRNGLWRLTTHDNYAYHLGNVYEDWMTTKVTQISIKTNAIVPLLPFPTIKKYSKLMYFIKNKLFILFFNDMFYRKYFYKMKGIPKDLINKY